MSFVQLISHIIAIVVWIYFIIRAVEIYRRIPQNKELKLLKVIYILMWCMEMLTCIIVVGFNLMNYMYFVNGKRYFDYLIYLLAFTPVEMFLSMYCLKKIAEPLKINNEYWEKIYTTAEDTKRQLVVGGVIFLIFLIFVLFK